MVAGGACCYCVISIQGVNSCVTLTPLTRAPRGSSLTNRRISRETAEYEFLHPFPFTIASRNKQTRAEVTLKHSTLMYSKRALRSNFLAVNALSTAHASQGQIRDALWAPCHGAPFSWATLRERIKPKALDMRLPGKDRHPQNAGQLRLRRCPQQSRYDTLMSTWEPQHSCMKRSHCAAPSMSGKNDFAKLPSRAKPRRVAKTVSDLPKSGGRDFLDCDLRVAKFRHFDYQAVTARAAHESPTVWRAQAAKPKAGDPRQ